MTRDLSELVTTWPKILTRVRFFCHLSAPARVTTSFPSPFSIPLPKEQTKPPADWSRSWGERLNPIFIVPVFPARIKKIHWLNSNKYIYSSFQCLRFNFNPKFCINSQHSIRNENGIKLTKNLKCHQRGGLCEDFSHGGFCCSGQTAHCRHNLMKLII